MHALLTQRFRLKVSLNLPPIQPYPSIPPRIYNRLYAHLDNILPNTTGARTPGRNGTPRSTKKKDVPGSTRSLPSRATPSKDKSLAQFRSNAAHTPTKSTGKAFVPAHAAERVGLHPWIQPTIRFLCRKSGNLRLAPSVLAGVEAAVVPGGKRTSDDWVKSNLAALCAALYFFVVQQVRKLETGEEVSQETYLPARREIIGLLGEAREELRHQFAARGYTEDDAWESWSTVKAREFDAAVQEVTDRGWLDGDWFRGLSDVISRPGDVEAGEDRGRGAEKEEEDYSVKMTVRRADTMFQDRYDFLNEAKRRDYRIWKDGILRQIELLEREASETMEVDS